MRVEFDRTLCDYCGWTSRETPEECPNCKDERLLYLFREETPMYLFREETPNPPRVFITLHNARKVFEHDRPD